MNKSEFIGRYCTVDADCDNEVFRITDIRIENGLLMLDVESITTGHKDSYPATSCYLHRQA